MSTRKSAKSAARLVIKGKLRVVLIDRKTRSIKHEVEVDNAFCVAGADAVLKLIVTGYGTATNPWSYVSLYDVNKVQIKSIGPGSWGTTTDTGTALQNTITVEDTSADEYTVQYFGLDTAGIASYGDAKVNSTVPSAITKTAADTLRVEWTISVGYEAPP